MAESEWGEMYRGLAWLPGGRLNIAHEAIDRHANGRLRDSAALVWEGASGERETYTFGQLKRLSSRFAHVLASLGIGRGDPVFTYMTRTPELYVALVGILKIGAIAAPLFSGLSPESVRDGMRQTRAKVLVTQPDLRARIAPYIPELWELQHIVVADRHGRGFAPMDMADLSYDEEMDKAPLDFEVEPMSQYDHALLLYTSGTMSTPKGVLHCHGAIAHHRDNGGSVLGLGAGDVLWCTADPGFALGMACGVLAPWSNGAAVLAHEGGFDSESWYRAIRRNRVAVWYTAPEALEMLMRGGEEARTRHDPTSLRSILTVGGHAGDEAAEWSRRVFGVQPLDTWGQAETGAVMIADRQPVRRDARRGYGTAHPRRRGGHPGRGLPGGGGAVGSGKAGGAPRLAGHVPGLLGRRGALQRQVPPGLVRQRRPGADGRRRLLPIRGTRPRR